MARCLSWPDSSGTTVRLMNSKFCHTDVVGNVAFESLTILRIYRIVFFISKATIENFEDGDNSFGMAFILCDSTWAIYPVIGDGYQIRELACSTAKVRTFEMRRRCRRVCGSSGRLFTQRSASFIACEQAFVATHSHNPMSPCCSRFLYGCPNR